MRRHIGRHLLPALLLIPIASLPAGCAPTPRPETSAPAPALPPLADRVRTLLADPALEGTRWGLVVATPEGEELLAIAPDERFLPASNTKLFTTAAAFATLAGLEAADPAGGTAVRLERRPGRRTPDIALVGSGDGTLADRPDCIIDCLSMLADAVLRSGVKAVHDVIGDDRLYPDERWGPGWSWNNLQTRSGTAVSALTINDNVVALRVLPARAAGEPPETRWDQGDEDYFTLRNDAATIAQGEIDLRTERLPGSRILRLYGSIPLGAEPETIMLGVEDPAQFAAMRFRRLLEARGIRVTGATTARHRMLALADDPKSRIAAPPPFPAPLPAPLPEPAGPALARLEMPPLAEDLRLINKVSQNLHAELMLRRLARTRGGSGSTEEGLAVVRAMLATADIPGSAFDFSDESGMSTYNRVTPRMVARFLRWTMGQPWGAAWRATFPVGGVDGTLTRRFAGTPLAGRLFAKTGTLNGTNALSGFLTAASGRTLIFSIYANDIPSKAESATAAMDAALQLIADQN
ncbi:D-alanyl-D-alanine carboxypeptidase/D-alanyl-D-alanine-endopeptidase [Sphingomonas oleivorans]|uniref:D-alanyl-D-alanine carboxypeptidase/D-alanyl-D-alanine-endopeptidase n=1 Tax=Sphingomonas oleivorans TaxID=1735121 RepID=A0A2T5FZX0_9SPHN|nr:D-alanyl-D-alanine carboxypeptidase/D-alanyl-D-alanine-endopeptidase [Sphingomonas oleivorans]PTQ12250.1 D-alanyl-D-alanine carboxypeptidase/D-alanyl-D-alanine-endopeptidase [Sphingomonas oleivorans]